MKKRIYLVDDHPILREGLAKIINAYGDAEICGLADDAESALEEIGTLQPDLVISDVSLPNKSGLELIKDLRALYPSILVLVFSMHDEALYAERVMRAGAKGYLMKGEPADQISAAIDLVLNGEIYLSTASTKRILKNLSGKQSSRPQGVANLSDRELDIFELIGRGGKNVQISTKLHISPKTVDAHRANIKEKLSLPDAGALVREAVLWVEMSALKTAAAPMRDEVAGQ